MRVDTYRITCQRHCIQRTALGCLRDPYSAIDLKKHIVLLHDVGFQGISVRLHAVKLRYVSDISVVSNKKSAG